MIYLITPCYNATATLGRTLESIAGQQGVALRYHVQDGASSDGSQDLLAAFAERLAADPVRYGHIVFTWASEEDRGMYDAIERAFSRLDIPPGALMGWLNADDTLTAGALALVNEAAQSLPQCDWFGGVPQVVDEQSGVVARGRTDFIYPQQLIAAGACDGLHWRNLQQEGSFWRKRLWDAAGGIDSSFRLAGDWDLWRRMALHSAYVQLPYVLACFYKRKGQLSEGESYETELNAALGRTVRRRSLRDFLLKNRNSTFGQLVHTPNRGWEYRTCPLTFTWRDVVGLLLVSSGFYSMFRLCQRMALG